MPSPTTEISLLGQFARGTKLPASGQPTSPLTICVPTYSYLWAISMAGAKGRGAWHGAGEHRIPQEGGEGGRLSGGNARGIGGLKGVGKASVYISR